MDGIQTIVYYGTCLAWISSESVLDEDKIVMAVSSSRIFP